MSGRSAFIRTRLPTETTNARLMKLRVLVSRAKASFLRRKQGTAYEKRIVALKHTAEDLDKQARNGTLEAQNLVKTANDTPRPSTPPPRDPLFKRPQDAPLSEYEKRVKAYNILVDDNSRIQDKLRLLQERVSTFNEEVRQVKASHVPSKRVTMLDHDVEGLENASGHLDVAMLKFAAEVGEAKRAAI